MKKLLLAASLLLVLTGCEKLGLGLGSTPTLNVASAKSIVTAKDGASYVVTADNVVNDLKFYDGDKEVSNSLASATVDYSVSINDDYMYMKGSFWFKNSQGSTVDYKHILVRKSDGAIFDMGAELSDDLTRLGDKPVREDIYGNYYFSGSSYDNALCKLNISNPDNITRQSILPAGQNCKFFEIDGNGNCLYKYGEGQGVTSSNGTYLYRMVKTTGGIEEIEVSGRDNREAWVGANGVFYLITYTWSNGYVPQIHTVVNNNGKVEIKTVWDGNEESVGKFFRTQKQGSFLIKKKNSVVFVDTYFGGSASFEFFEESKTVSMVNLPPIEQSCKIVYNEDYYYIATGNNLYRVDMDTNSYENLLNKNEYSVYEMAALANGVLEVSALRFSDGKNVLFNVLPDKSIRIVDEQRGIEAVSLARIN